MSESGQDIIELNQLSSAASSKTTSREQSRDRSNQLNQSNNKGRAQNRKGRRRSLTPHKNKKNQNNNYKNKNGHRPGSKQRKSSRQHYNFGRSGSRSNSRGSVFSNRSYYKQTSKRQAWKSKICKYWKKGQCKYGDNCEWQHYDFTQIDYCETNKKERYNHTKQKGKYLVQITTAAYLTEEEIMTLIGQPTQLRQAIAIAIKNKRQSKMMKKEIMKELRKGQFNDIQKLAIKKQIIRKYMQNMQVDTANELAMKKIEKKEREKNSQKKLKNNISGKQNRRRGDDT